MRSEIKIITLAIVLLVSLKSQAQVLNNNPVIIKWEKGSGTLMHELDRVWIETKTGKMIKKAKLWEINKEKGMIVYEKEGSLHDLLISNIEKIHAGNNSLNVMYFDLENNPKIKPSGNYYDDFTGFSDFKISKHAIETVTVTETKKPVEIKEENKTDVIEKNNGQLNDTIVKANGQIVFAKIKSMTDSEIRYKRTDLPEGPDYVIETNSCAEIIKNLNSIKVIMKKP